MDSSPLRREVVVTGVGAIGPHGFGREPLAQALKEGRPVASEVDRSGGHHHPDSARLAGLLPSLDLSTRVPPAASRRMGMLSKLAVAASRMALQEAGIEEGDSVDPRTAVFMATAFGPSSFTEGLLRQVLLEGPEAAQPFLFSECVANAAAAQVAIAVGAGGANVTLTQREAGPLLALGRGATEVREGRADRALAGAVEEITPLVHALLDRYGALARGGRGKAEVARPFDRRRNGFLASEGATVLVLEAEATARVRGARLLARVRAAGSGFDPTSSNTDWGCGDEGLAEQLRAFLDRIALYPTKVDRIVSGASGSIRGDRLEARVLRKAWQEQGLPPVLAPKGVTGEYGGAILSAAMLSAEGYEFGPTAGFEEMDEDLNLVPHPGGPAPSPSSILVTSFAAGGAAAWLVLERA